MNAIVARNLLAATPVTERPLVRVVIVGSVDHGKSTLIGRLLHETGNLPEGKLDQLKAVSARRGAPFEWSFLLDALQTERDQGITIDTSQIRLRTNAKDFVLIDAPGHAEFLRNMITGAAQADGAILMIDAGEGVREQTRRHAYLLHLLGIQQVIVVINKMDRIDYDAGRFRVIEEEISTYLQGLGLTPAAVIPVSAHEGVGITEHTYTAEWYRPTVVAALNELKPAQLATDLSLRLPVQAVYKFDDRRIIAGRIQSGHVAVGDSIIVQPSGSTARVRSIEVWPSIVGLPGPREATAGQSVGLTLDRELFVERGDLVTLESAPAQIGRQIRARVFWLHPEPLQPGSRVIVRAGTAEDRGTVIKVERAIDPGQLLSVANGQIGRNSVGEVTIELATPLAADPHTLNHIDGRIVLDFGGRIAGGGLILSVDAGANIPTRSSLHGASLHSEAERLTRLLADLTPAERLAKLRSELAGKITFTTSFGLEDQVLLHLLAEQQLDLDVVTLDTGRMFNETYDVWAESELRYGRAIRVIVPDRSDLETLVRQQGINGFYKSAEARVECCRIRKVLPLGRALDGAQAWVTGLRADQSANRQRSALVEVDTAHGLLKISPLLDWTRDQTLAFASAHNVPLNPLHEKGFASIGCAPCTRAIQPGDPERAGRWWWEQEQKKECGLHTGIQEDEISA